MNAYVVLGISQTASKSDIKEAYRRLAKRYHPDRNKNSDVEPIIIFTSFQHESYDVLHDMRDRIELVLRNKRRR